MLNKIEKINFSKVKYLLAALLFFALGITCYLVYHQKIIIFWSNSVQGAYSVTPARRKNFTLYFFKDYKFFEEEKELIDSDDISKTINYLVSAWLNFLEGEHLIQKAIAVQSILLNQLETEVFISFDRNPLDKNSSILQKLGWVTGLLKTIKKNKPKIERVNFLTHNKPIQDPHIDFSHSWPTDFYF